MFLKIRDKVKEFLFFCDGCFLFFYNDLSYWGGYCLVEFFYCVENYNLGGEFILVDGFWVV